MKNINQNGVVHIITLLILLAGIAVAVILVQREQIYKSRATNENEIYNAFEFSSNEPGKTITCSGNTCQSDTLNINIRINDLNALGD